MLTTLLTPDNTRFFEQVLAALKRHSGEPGVEELEIYFGAASRNYKTGSMDYMLKALIFALHSLTRFPMSDGLRQEIQDAVQTYYDGFHSGPSLREMAQKYVESGGRIYTLEEILAERNS